MIRGCGHPYGYPRPVAIFLYTYPGIRADDRVELSVLRTVRPRLGLTLKKKREEDDTFWKVL